MTTLLQMILKTDAPGCVSQDSCQHGGVAPAMFPDALSCIPSYHLGTSLLPSGTSLVPSGSWYFIVTIVVTIGQLVLHTIDLYIIGTIGQLVLQQGSWYLEETSGGRTNRQPGQGGKERLKLNIGMVLLLLLLMLMLLLMMMRMMRILIPGRHVCTVDSGSGSPVAALSRSRCKIGTR